MAFPAALQYVKMWWVAETDANLAFSLTLSLEEGFRDDSSDDGRNDRNNPR